MEAKVCNRRANLAWLGHLQCHIRDERGQDRMTLVGDDWDTQILSRLGASIRRRGYFMLRSILLLLDETPAAVAACGVAASLARRCSAQLGGIYFASTGFRSQGDLSASEAYRSLQLTMSAAPIVLSR